jgi:hypothetical protein
MAFGAAMFFIGIGVLTMVFASDATMLAAGLLLAAVSGLSAYKIAVSTMNLIDAEPGDHGWRNVSL